MKRHIAEAIVDIMNEQGETEASIYEEYSGRAMYGKITTGIVVDNPMSLLKAVLADSLEGEMSLLREHAEKNEISPLDVNEIRFDSLGLQTIVY